MRGVAFLTADNDLNFRTEEYLNEVNPYFFTENYHYVIRAWRFDTDDLDSMRAMVRDLNLFFPTNSTAKVDLCNAIGFDPRRLRDLK